MPRGLRILLAVFVGGALGSLARFLILLGFESASLSNLSLELASTATVNLSGAVLLGIVNSPGFRADETAVGFWGAGFAGGFTTMSGLALIITGATLGVSESAVLLWLSVAIQFALGILAYWLGTLWRGFKKPTPAKPETVS